jgi:hypothetical protein
MAAEDKQDGVNQKKKAVDVMYRSDGYVGETTTKYNDGTVETTLQRIERMKMASRTSVSAEDLKNLPRNQQLPSVSSSSISPPSQKPKDIKTEQEK